MADGTTVAAALVALSALTWWWAGSGGRGRDATRALSPPEATGAERAQHVTSRSTLGSGGSERFARPGRLPSSPRARGPTTDEVAGGMVLLAVALQSGCGVVEAVEAASAVAPGAAAHDLAVVAAALRWGVPDDEAWGAVSPAWGRTSVALRLAVSAGVAPSSLLLSGADDLRRERLAAVEVSTARLGVRLVLPLGLAFLPAFVMTTVVPVVLAMLRQVLQP